MIPPPIKSTSVSCSFDADASAAFETALSPTAIENSLAVILFMMILPYF